MLIKDVMEGCHSRKIGKVKKVFFLRSVGWGICYVDIMHIMFNLDICNFEQHPLKNVKINTVTRTLGRVQLSDRL